MHRPYASAGRCAGTCTKSSTCGVTVDTGLVCLVNKQIVTTRDQATSDSPFARHGGLPRRALPGDARCHNQALVWRSISRDGPLSRADLGRATRRTRAATSELIAERIAAGLVDELGQWAARGVGKPATLLGL